VEGLNNKLRDALENEDYEEAAELRDKIEDIKS
jgi:protein-arginine kinase activator protein McsA